MLSVCAMRHGLLDSVWAKPTLYLSFVFSLGSSWADAPVSPRLMAATPVARARKVLLSIVFLHGNACFQPLAGVLFRMLRGRSGPRGVTSGRKWSASAG